jgi:ubiquinone/menaquinone biosynthesis C-methylase UbiE
MPLADYEGWMAGAYDAGRSLAPEAVAAWAAAARPWLAPPGTGPVVDLGAGTGRFSGHLVAWSGGPVVAIEPTAAMAARAAAKGLAGVRVVRGGAEDLPLAPGSVRAVWMSQVVHHVDDLGRAAGELARVVRPGGHVLIRGQMAEDLGDPRPLLYRYFPAARDLAVALPGRARVVTVLHAAGFDEVLAATVEQVTAASLREFHDRQATRADSLLASIDDRDFAAGLDALARDAAAEGPPVPVLDRLTLLVLRRR